MGTSEFAVPTLIQLHSSSHDILAVVTKPDRPKGRGRKMSQSPVKKAATDLGYTTLQPNSVNEDKFISTIENFEPDLFVVLAFGQILCEKLLGIPKQGAINVHPSLIPKYRGPSPIQQAIISGDTETGVTTILMDGGVDTGCILMSKTTNIGSCETSTCLHNKLSKMGSDLLLETIRNVRDNTLTLKPQDSRFATVAPLLRKEDGEIDWNNSALKIKSFIRGMNPWPGAFTFYDGNRLKIISSSVVEDDSGEPPGTILKSCKKSLIIATGINAISIEMIQGTSGKSMPINAFLCGFHFKVGLVMGKKTDCKS